MSNLYDYLQQSAERDANSAWKRTDNPDIALLGSAKDVDDWLNEHPESRSSIQLAAVSGWYSSSPERQFAKTVAGFDDADPKSFVNTYTNKLGVRCNTGIKKLLFTDATQKGGTGLKSPSWFISPETGDNAIKPGDEFILVDDFIESGGTLRDMIKHINLRGGTVKAVVNGSLNRDIGTNKKFFRPEIQRRDLNIFAATVYGAERDLHGSLDAITQCYGTQDPFLLLPDDAPSKEDIMNVIETTANHHLRPHGLSLQQLTDHEIGSLIREIKAQAKGNSFSFDQFMENRTSSLNILLPPPIEKLDNLQRLSKMLGTEFNGKWTNEQQEQLPKEWTR